MQSVTIAEGATIGFGINSTDGSCGFATLTITSFQWPGNCPLNECGNFVTAGGFGNGFTGYYAPGEWTTNLDGGNGSVSLPTPLSAQVLGNNNLISDSQTSFTSTAVAAGTISLNWSWAAADSGFLVKLLDRHLLYSKSVIPIQLHVQPRVWAMFLSSLWFVEN